MPATEAFAPGGAAATTGDPTSGARGLRRWSRLLGAGAVLGCGPSALLWTEPQLAVTLVLVEVGAVAAALLVFGVPLLLALLCGSEQTSERCFRLLRWLADRPEHPAPTASPHPAARENRDRSGN